MLPDRRSSDVIRLLWLAVTLAIVYLSLYPLEGWRLRQPSAFAYLGHGLPRYYTRTDLVSNVAAYLVFGLLFQLAWFRQWRQPWPVLLTTLAGLVLSIILESLQSYLPTRVPSILDVLSNTAGAALGALIGVLVIIGLERRATRLPTASALWYSQGPMLGWVLLVGWWLGQLTPQRVMFSGGSLLTSFAPTAAPMLDWLARQLGGPGLGAGDGGSGGATGPAAWAGTPVVGGVFETLAITATIALVGILVMDLVRTATGRITWIGIALSMALALRAISAPPATRESLLAVWLTPGAQAALVLSAAVLYLLAAFGRRTRLWLGLALVPLAMMLTYFASIDPYYLATREIGRGLLDPAMTPSLRSLVSALGNGWPLMLAVYCGARLASLPGKQASVSL